MSGVATRFLNVSGQQAARATAEEAFSLARERSMRIAEVYALLARSHVLLEKDGAAAAGTVKEDLDRALALVGPSRGAIERGSVS